MMLLPTEEEKKLYEALNEAKTEAEKEEIREKLDAIYEERITPLRKMGFAV